jgi:protein phosphatase
MELYGITDKGKVRKQNQDEFRTLFDENSDIAVFAVCDGMGGAKSGNVASSIAADVFIGEMRGYIGTMAGVDDLPMRIADAVISANRAVYEKSVSDIACAGMGTTIVAAVVTEGVAFVANVGDSRAYRITEHSIEQISKDHSLVENMIDSGELTRQQARRHPSKNLITRALGTNETEDPDVFTCEIKQGESLLLCSDGLSNIIEENELLFEVRRGKTASEICGKLLEMTLERGAPDNVTVVVFSK